MTMLRRALIVVTATASLAGTLAVSPPAARANICSSQDRITCGHDFLGDYPRGSEKSFNKNAQGITHGANYWYITQVDKLHKIHVRDNLADPRRHPEAGIPLRGYDHFGAPDFDGGYFSSL